MRKIKLLLGVSGLLFCGSFMAKSQIVDFELVNFSVQLPVVQESEQGLTGSVTVKNKADGLSPSGTIRYFVSGDEMLTPDDKVVGERSFGAINPGETLTNTFSYGGVLVEGGNHIIAKIIPVSGEADSLDNVKTFGPVSVSNALLPDLKNFHSDLNKSIVFVNDRLDVRSLVSVFWGQSNNSITGKAGYYLSVDPNYDISDIYLGATDFNFDYSGAAYLLYRTVEASLPIPAGTTAGTYYLISRFDYQNAITEQSETNNSSSIQFHINAVPKVEITSPGNDAVYSFNSDITITANASDEDGTITRVEFYNGTTLLGTSMSAPYNFTWTKVDKGAYDITAKVYDNLGQTGISLPVSITVKAPDINIVPKVEITSPGSNTTYPYNSDIIIYANASDEDGTVARVEFYNGGTLLGTALLAPYSFTWAKVDQGVYDITAKVYDNLGQEGVSSPVLVTVSPNAAPEVKLTGFENIYEFVGPLTLPLTADASDIDGVVTKVEFYQGETLLGTDAAIPYTFNWENVGIGNYQLRAIAYDDQGASSTSFTYYISVLANDVNDLQVTQMTAPQNVVPGEDFMISSIIHNSASTTFLQGTIKYYLSTDNELDENDVFLKDANFGHIHQSGDSNVVNSLRIPADITEGDYYILVLLEGQSNATARMTAEQSVGYVKISVSRTTAVNDLMIAGEVNIYPNPTNGFFTVKSGFDTGALAVKTLYGESLLNQAFDGQVVIDINHLAAGIYLIEVSGGSGVQTFKLIKN